MGKAEFRAQAIGMLEAGTNQAKVAELMKVSVRTVKRWWKRWTSNKSLLDEKRSGRPSVLGKKAKLVISKSVHKRGWSTRKLANKLTSHGHHCSKDTVHRYLRFNVGASSFKRPVIPKINEKQAKKRLQFAKERQNWTYEDWKKIIFTDECPVYLSVPGNRQNDRVWALNKSKVEPVEKSKFSPIIMVWGAMTATGLSQLHVLPQKQNVTAKYYQDNILNPFLLGDVNRTSDTGPVTERRFHENTSDLIFQQDGAPAHTALGTQEWLRSNFPQFWDKDTWPPNSPDLSPIENIWAIIKERVNMSSPQPRDLKELQQTVETCWKRIDPETLQNLIKSMPDRINSVIRAKGYFPLK